MGIPPRYYDKCDQKNPLRADIDLDSDQEYQRIGEIKHDFAASSEVQVQVDENSYFRLIPIAGANPLAPGGGAEPIWKQIVPSERPVTLVVNTRELERNLAREHVASDGVMSTKATVRVYGRGGRAERKDVHVRLGLYHSGPPVPVVDLEMVPEIDLGSDVVPEDRIRVGSVRLTLRDQSPALFRGQARFRATIHARIGDYSLPVSVRTVRADGAEPNGQWLQFPAFSQAARDSAQRDGAEFSHFGVMPQVDLPLELVGDERTFLVPQIDIGVPLRSLREITSQLRIRPEERIPVEVEIESTLIADGTLSTLPVLWGQTVVFGTMNDSVVVSGLCDMKPARLVLSPNHDDPKVYPFPPIRARLREVDQRVVCEPVEMQLASELPSDAFVVEARLVSPSQRVEIDVDCVTSEGRCVFKVETALVQALSRHAGEDDLMMIILLTARQDDAVYGYQFEANVAFERESDPWTVCIDFGTSSIAIWVGRGPAQEGHQLKLGTWLSSIDEHHPEAAIWRGPLPHGSNDSYLLPSYIGLSRDLNIRADFDPLSLGDLGLSRPGPEAEARRLQALDLNYDVSLPFPASSRMTELAGSVVTEPKRRMILRNTETVLTDEVAERSAGGSVATTRTVDLAQLMIDCFGELGAFVVPRAAHRELASDSRNRVLTQFLAARLDPQERFRVVVTHPCGIDNNKRDIYRASAERFLERFTGRPYRTAGSVVLVAEAFAAARFGIDYRYSNQPVAGATAERTGPATFIALDLGAGTFDATVITTRAPSAEHWHVYMHFGLVVGGRDLDRALLTRIASILGAAAATNRIALAFDIRLQSLDQGDEADTMASAMQNQFAREFQAAKFRLNAQLMDDASEDYVWKSRRDGGAPLEIKIGDSTLSPGPNPTSSWPTMAHQGAGGEYDIDGVAARIAFERWPPQRAGAGGTDGPAQMSVILKVWREAFEGPALGYPDGVEDLTELMGTELPKCALAQVPDGAGMPIAIVTGRTALWPLLHERIAKAIGGDARKSGRLLMPKPFTPEQMKQAIVRGAVTLARETHGNDEIGAFLDNPIAIVSFRIDAFESGRGARWATAAGRVIDKIHILIDGASAEGQTEIDISGSFVIARILPGIDREEGAQERHRLFQRVKSFTGVSPILPLTSELQNPVPGPRGRATWKVQWWRDLIGWRIVFETEKQKRIEFGPFTVRRVYAPE